MLEQLVRPNILRLKPYRCARDTVQDGVLLDANENPYPGSWAGVALNRYPDPSQRELRQALSEYAGLAPQCILAGSGSDEVLEWIFKVFVEPGSDQVAVVEPTYGMYRVLADIHNVPVFEFRLSKDSFGFDAARFLDAVPDQVKAAFLCSPNNPTGNLLDCGQLLDLCRNWPKLVVVDEAYIEFADHHSLAQQVVSHPNLIVLRTLSKAWGQAAIRLGYALADPAVISYFQKVKAPYNLNALTMRRGIDCLRQGLPAQISEILRQRKRLVEALRLMPGIDRVFPTQANFVLFRCRQPSLVCRRMLEKGIVIRERSSLPGLEGCLRVSVGLPEENDLLLGELGAVLGEEVSRRGAEARRETEERR